MIGKRKSTIHASFWDAFKARPLRAGIPAELAHPHSLKHTSGTKTLELLGDFYLVKEHLGHRSIQSTEVCARVTGKTREERADRLHDWKWVQH